jgi:hypothetical protein
MNRISKVLEVIEVPEELSIENLSERILSVLNYYEVKEKVWRGIADNVKDEAGAMANAGLEWEPCVVHTLDLTLKHAATAAKIRISKMKLDLKKLPDDCDKLVKNSLLWND